MPEVPSENMEIRPYRPSDQRLQLAVFRKHTPEMFAPGEVAVFKDYLERMPETYYSLLADEKVIGGAGLYYHEEDQSGRISWIFIDPAYLGQGLGRRLSEHCHNLLILDPRVQKLVVRTSQKAWQFFTRLGYQLISTESDYWGPGLDLYLMERPLNR